MKAWFDNTFEHYTPEFPGLMINFMWKLMFLCSCLQDSIELDKDLIANSERSLETLVSVGMTLGVAKSKQSAQELPNVHGIYLKE